MGIQVKFLFKRHLNKFQIHVCSRVQELVLNLLKKNYKYLDVSSNVEPVLRCE